MAKRLALSVGLCSLALWNNFSSLSLAVQFSESMLALSSASTPTLPNNSSLHTSFIGGIWLLNKSFLLVSKNCKTHLPYSFILFPYFTFLLSIYHHLTVCFILLSCLTIDPVRMQFQKVVWGGNFCILSLCHWWL